MGFLLFFLIIVIGFIGYQLYKSNTLNRIKIIQEEGREKQKEDDELLKEKYPHIFFDYRKKLREYYGHWEEIQEKEKRAQKLTEHLTLASSSDLLGDVYDLLINPFTIIDFLKNKSKDNKVWLEHIKKLENGAGKIYQEARKESFLTENEIWFLYFRFWKNIFETDYPSREATSGFSSEELLLDTFSETLNRYKTK